MFYFYRAIIRSGCLIDNSIYNHVCTNGGSRPTKETKMEHYTREHSADGARPMYEERVQEIAQGLLSRVRKGSSDTSCGNFSLPAAATFST